MQIKSVEVRNELRPIPVYEDRVETVETPVYRDLETSAGEMVRVLTFDTKEVTRSVLIRTDSEPAKVIGVTFDTGYGTTHVESYYKESYQQCINDGTSPKLSQDVGTEQAVQLVALAGW